MLYYFLVRFLDHDYHIQGVFDGICLILFNGFSAQLCRWVTKHQFGRRWSFRILQPKGLRSPIDEASQQVGVRYSSLLGAQERHDEEEERGCQGCQSHV